MNWIGGDQLDHESWIWRFSHWHFAIKEICINDKIELFLYQIRLAEHRGY